MPCGDAKRAGGWFKSFCGRALGTERSKEIAKDLPSKVRQALPAGEAQWDCASTIGLDVRRAEKNARGANIVNEPAGLTRLELSSMRPAVGIPCKHSIHSTQTALIVRATRQLVLFPHGGPVFRGPVFRRLSSSDLRQRLNRSGRRHAVDDCRLDRAVAFVCVRISSVPSIRATCSIDPALQPPLRSRLPLK
jgi:hypothetical protein